MDANTIGDLNAPSEHGAPVLKWALTGNGGIVVGGKLLKELAVSKTLMKTLAVLNQAGRLHRVEEQAVAATTREVILEKKCKSNDPHVIAVARLSGCRLIFSKDEDLHADAKNREVLNPPASIYQTKDHKRLLTECRCGK